MSYQPASPLGKLVYMLNGEAAFVWAHISGRVRVVTRMLPLGTLTWRGSALCGDIKWDWKVRDVWEET